MSNKKRLSREEQVETVQNALSNKAAKEALIQARLSKKGKEEADFRSEFSNFWAKNKKAYGKSKDLDIEGVLWVHLKASGHDTPEQFEAGIKHFGLEKK